MNDDNHTPARRRFIKLAGATTAMFAAGASASAARTHLIEVRQDTAPAKRVSPNDRIRIACIGIGGQGTADTTQALKVPGVELVAVADVYDGRLKRAKETFENAPATTNATAAIATSIGGVGTVGTGKRPVATTRDYREILARTDVDAVIIATPDHWHRQIAVEAMRAGKDVYLEKPMIYELSDGDQIIKAQNETKRICQIGSQRVSSIVYKKAKDLIAAGAIGKLTLVEASWRRNSPLGAWQYSLPPDAAPTTIDWEGFLGSAPKRPFDPVRLFRWRNYRDYGTGIPGDLFVHLFTGIHYVLDSTGPNRVMATGGLRYWDDKRDVPDVMVGIYDYPKTTKHDAFNLQLNVNFADGGGGEETFRFVGSDAVLSLSYGGVTLTRSPKLREPGYSINTFPKETQEAFLKEYRKLYPEPTNSELSARPVENYVIPSGYNDHFDHFKNWIAAMRSRETPIEDAVFGFRAAGPAVLSNAAHFERKVYRWDPEKMTAKAE